MRGVFEINFDKREFSAVHIMDGWQTWAMRDVSAAAYHATRSQFASSDDKWRKLLDHLSGKEITSAGHLSLRNFSFGDEIIEMDGKLNFYVRTEFDVDAVFGTFVCTDENDDWLNIYANYDIAEDRPLRHAGAVPLQSGWHRGNLELPAQRGGAGGAAAEDGGILSEADWYESPRLRTAISSRNRNSDRGR